MLVLPLDRQRRWYRYHHLLREYLLGELRMDMPEELTELHSRAATWYESNGRPEQAVEHAMTAGDADRVARLVLDLMSPVWASGRAGTVLRWMAWLARYSVRPAQRRTHGARLPACMRCWVGPVRRKQLAGVAERLPATGTLPDGSSVAATLAYLRANLARTRCGDDAARRDHGSQGPEPEESVPGDDAAPLGRLVPAPG